MFVDYSNKARDFFYKWFGINGEKYCIFSPSKLPIKIQVLRADEELFETTNESYDLCIIFGHSLKLKASNGIVLQMGSKKVDIFAYFNPKYQIFFDTGERPLTDCPDNVVIQTIKKMDKFLQIVLKRFFYPLVTHNSFNETFNEPEIKQILENTRKVYYERTKELIIKDLQTLRNKMRDNYEKLETLENKNIDFMNYLDLDILTKHPQIADMFVGTGPHQTTGKGQMVVTTDHIYYKMTPVLLDAITQANPAHVTPTRLDEEERRKFYEQFEFYFGVFQIIIPFDPTEHIYISNIARNQTVGGNKLYFPHTHPHVHGHICWGTASEQVMLFSNPSDWMFLIHTILGFLNQINEEEVKSRSWGYSTIHFPLVTKDHKFYWCYNTNKLRPFNSKKVKGYKYNVVA